MPDHAMEHIAHRGARRERPENTIGAFLRAFERGADGIELDVHATRDEVVVIHHDPTLGPTFGALTGHRIADMDWAAIANASVPPEYAVPTLDQLLSVVPDAVAVYVEIKAPDIERLVARAIRESRARCAVHSFDHEAIARMRDLAPEIPRGILFDALPAPGALTAALEATGARDVWPRWQLIDRALVDAVHAAGARAIAWTVNRTRAAEALADMGVDGLCTDDVRIVQDL